ncbi:hypothetical protein FHX42_003532 [Saccharopolyspora lacisalsi]|uniref:Uncharacterized protein n=1 Tax=Halosaccharopolyspora lacisalsi TaxID=1000566 RepID=A0A839E0V2_9PSEU|nr:hypothetical protein [Halosaccharopolyspora lacisalsi]MBA8826156.1 hypothetical protein [Halosaccharopolyspora lacisalsi]
MPCRTFSAPPRRLRSPRSTPHLNRATVLSANFCRIIRPATYCKGYDDGNIDGTYNAHQIGVARPAPNTSQDVPRQLLARYTGTNEDAQQYGRELVGLYRVLENYNAIARSN